MIGAGMDVRVASNGRLILPRPVRAATGLTGDTELRLGMEGGVVRLVPPGHRVRRARELYRAAVTSPRTAEDVPHDRRAEAAADAEEGEPGRYRPGDERAA